MDVHNLHRNLIEFFNEYHHDPNDPDAPAEEDGMSDGMFRFEKRM